LGELEITIVGLGLIGGSFAKALKKIGGVKIYGVDIDENALKVAKDMNIIDAGYKDPVEALKKSDMVIMCLYPDLTVDFISEYMKSFKSGGIITDTAGIKENLVSRILSILREDIDYIPGHPMAGREFKGLEFSSEKIFEDANYILTPTPLNTRKNIETLERLIKEIGCKRIVKVSARDHDQVIAYTSGMPHLLAAALMNSCESDSIYKFSANSFKDFTRVARMNESLWAELILSNRDFMLNEIEAFENKFLDMKNAIINSDNDLLEESFKSARLRREEFVRKSKS
jgi:prephenate dehydrogenase